MGNARWSIVLLLLCLSCRVATSTPPYPPGRCADGSCNGRVTTVGVLARNQGSITSFSLLDLGGSPAHAGKLIRVYCDGCPLKVGATYRARMNKDELIYSLMLDGTEIFHLGNDDPATARTDRLALDWALSQPACDLATSHWEAVNGEVGCHPGTGGPRVAWVNGDGLNPPVPGCSPNFPTGFLAKGSGPLAINIQLSSSYTLKEPELAHDVFPQFFVDTLNGVYWSGLEQRSSDNPRFTLADGVPAFYAAVVFNVDATGDHYGMTVSVTMLEDGTMKEVLVYSVPTLYKTAENLTRAAAIKAVELLEDPGGWTCEDGVTTPRFTIAQWCADHVDAYPELANDWVCQP